MGSEMLALSGGRRYLIGSCRKGSRGRIMINACFITLRLV